MKSKPTVVLAMSATLALALSAGCAVEEDPDLDDIEMAVSDVARDEAPVLAEGELDALVRGNADFAFDLYRSVRAAEDGNVVISPHSISIALAMTYAGAEGETEAEMAEALHFDLDEPRLHEAWNALDAELARREARLDVVNATWAQQGYAFLPDYLDTLARSYGAGMYLWDFAADPEGGRRLINAWVEDQTEDRIEDLIPEGILARDTRLVLVNAIYFQADWQSQFDPEDTRDGSFELDDGRTVEVPTMHQRAELPAAEGDGWVAVELPYAGGELSMIAILPDGDGAELEARLDGAALEEIAGGLEVREVVLSMPRFTVTSDISLREHLAALGMPTAFEWPGADFSGMDGTYELYIREVLHKGFISVGEEGTEAAAATAVIVAPGAIEPEFAVALDRPFIYLIRDRVTGAILFLGRLTDPSAD